MNQEPSFADLTKKGLWSNNPALVQLLGMCPLLAVSTTLINGLSLGLATLLVMGISSGSISLLRPWIPKDIRLPLFMLIIAALVTVVDLLWNAYAHALYRIIGLYVPLIVTNCIVLARVESFAYRHSFLRGAFDGLMMGAGGTLGLIILGTIRELIGQGTLGLGIELINPNWHHWSILPADYPGFLLARMPVGAFLGLGFMVALHQWINHRRKT